MIYQLFNETISDQNDARRMLSTKSSENKRLQSDLRILKIIKWVALVLNIILTLALAYGAYYYIYTYIGDTMLAVIAALAIVLVLGWGIFIANTIFRTVIDHLSVIANIEEYTRIMGLNHAESVSRIPVVYKHPDEVSQPEAAEEESPAE